MWKNTLVQQTTATSPAKAEIIITDNHLSMSSQVLC